MAETDTLLTHDEVLERLRIKRTRLYTLRKEGHLPPIRIGRGRHSLRWRESDVEAFIESSRDAQPAP